MGFMMLYFADTCIRRIRHPLWIFPVPVIMALLFAVNGRTGWMFRYVDGVYRRGPWLWTNYIAWLVYGTVMFGMVFRARKKLGRRTAGGLVLCFLFELGMQVYQFFVIDFYIGGISFTAGMLYLVLAPLFIESGRDDLTDLLNRRGFLFSMEEILRYDKEKEYAVVAVDIRDFRSINERFGVEALVRWNDPQYGLISPADFIPLHEENGSIGELDCFVCREVCKKIADWKQKGKTMLPVSINVSRIDLLTLEYADHLTALLEEYHLTPGDIRLEVTESAFVHASEIIPQLERLHAAGHKILIDDFGSGYSNFNSCASFPMDILKLDMGFVKDLGQFPRGEGILLGIADMAEKIAVPLVAEGVETQEQLAGLKEIGIRYAQGFLFSRPLPEAEFEERYI